MHQSSPRDHQPEAPAVQTQDGVGAQPVAQEDRPILRPGGINRSLQLHVQILGDVMQPILKHLQCIAVGEEWLNSPPTVGQAMIFVRSSTIVEWLPLSCWSYSGVTGR